MVHSFPWISGSLQNNQLVFLFMFICPCYNLEMSFLHSSVSKESAYNARDLDSVPRLGRSLGEGNGNPLQYSCLENPMDREAWRAIVHGIARVGHDLATKPPPPPTHALLPLEIHGAGGI